MHYGDDREGLHEISVGWIIVASKEALLTRFTKLYHLSSEVARCERARAIRALSKA